MNKIGKFLKKVLIVICVIALLTTCVNYSVKFYRKLKMEELIAIVTDDEAEITNEVISEIKLYLKSNEKIDTFEECFLNAFMDEYKEDYKKAIEDYLLALDYTDDNEKIAQVYRKVGIIDCQLGEYKDAVDYLKKSLEYDDTNNNALLYLSEAYLQQGDYAQALINVKKYADNNDLTFEQYETVLTMYININEYQGAINTVNAAMEKYPDKKGDLILYRLQANLLKDDLAAAMEDAHEYKELSDIEFNEEILCASFYSALGFYQKALDIYVAHIDNEEYELLESAIECAYQIDDYQTMYKLAELAIKHYGEDEQAIDYYKWQGIAEMQLGYYKTAVKSFNVYLNTYNTHYEVVYLRALCNFALTKYDDAITDFTLTIEYDTLTEDSLYNRALCYSQVGDMDNLRKDLEAVVEMKSGTETYANAVELLKVLDTSNEEVSE